MIRLLMLSAVLLTALLTAPVLLVRALPQADPALSAFFTPPATCEALCLLGLRPGITTVGEALEGLRAHDWVAEAELNATGRGYGDIKWTWSGQQPAFINAAHPGRITFYWDQDEEANRRRLSEMPIELVSVYTHFRIHEVQTWFGQPITGAAVQNVESNLNYSAGYFNAYGMMDLSTVVSCPANLMTFWDATAKITLSRWRGGGDYLPPAEAMRLC